MVASLHDWGTSLPPRELSGRWSPQASHLHINMLELNAVFLAVQCFVDQASVYSILVKSDNSSVVSYFNHQGGTLLVPLCLFTLRLLTWCRQRRLILSTSHIPGQQNFAADFLSRGNYLPSEWSFHPSVFQCIIRGLVSLQVDLFASSFSHLLPRYGAKTSDPNAWALDAFSTPWSDFLGFVFVWFCLIPRILEKVAQDQMTLPLVAPFWPKRPWFPHLLSPLSGPLKPFPGFPEFLQQTISRCHNKMQPYSNSQLFGKKGLTAAYFFGSFSNSPNTCF